MARPKKDVTKNKRVEVRLTEMGLNMLDSIADRLEITRTETISLSVMLLNAMIEEEEELERLKKKIHEEL